MSFLVREMGLEPTRLWLDTGTSSLPVCLFQHSRKQYSLFKREIYYSMATVFVKEKITVIPVYKSIKKGRCADTQRPQIILSAYR